MKHDYEGALEEKPDYTDDGYEAWAIHLHDTIISALKLAAKLKKSPSAHQNTEPDFYKHITLSETREKTAAKVLNRNYDEYNRSSKTGD